MKNFIRFSILFISLSEAFANNAKCIANGYTPVSQLPAINGTIKASFTPQINVKTLSLVFKMLSLSGLDACCRENGTIPWTIVCFEPIELRSNFKAGGHIFALPIVADKGTVHLHLDKIVMGEKVNLEGFKVSITGINPGLDTHYLLDAMVNSLQQDLETAAKAAICKVIPSYFHYAVKLCKTSAQDVEYSVEEVEEAFSHIADGMNADLDKAEGLEKFVVLSDYFIKAPLEALLDSYKPTITHFRQDMM